MSICAQSHGLRTYYFLPAFDDIREWYDAMERSYYIEATALYYCLQNKLHQVTCVIDFTDCNMRPCDKFIECYLQLNRNTVTAQSLRLPHLYDVIMALETFNDGGDRWAYLLKDEDHVF